MDNGGARVPTSPAQGQRINSRNGRTNAANDSNNTDGSKNTALNKRTNAAAKSNTRSKQLSEGTNTAKTNTAQWIRQWARAQLSAHRHLFYNITDGQKITLTTDSHHSSHFHDNISSATRAFVQALHDVSLPSYPFKPFSHPAYYLFHHSYAHTRSHVVHVTDDPSLYLGSIWKNNDGSQGADVADTFETKYGVSQRLQRLFAQTYGSSIRSLPSLFPGQLPDFEFVDSGSLISLSQNNNNSNNNSNSSNLIHVASLNDTLPTIPSNLPLYVSRSLQSFVSFCAISYQSASASAAADLVGNSLASSETALQYDLFLSTCLWLCWSAPASSPDYDDDFMRLQSIISMAKSNMSHPRGIRSSSDLKHIIHLTRTFRQQLKKKTF